MEKQTNPKLILSVTALVFVSVVVWQKVIKKNSQTSELLNIARMLEQASNNKDKFAAADQFEKLTQLKYKYTDEHNMPCLQAVMNLTSAADEVNTTGFWSNKEDSISIINQCKG